MPSNSTIAALKRWLIDEMAVIDDDERFHYPPADIDINGPLALIQVHLEARMCALKQVSDLLNGK